MAYLATVVSNDATLVTPTSGHGINVTWVYFGALDNTTENLIELWLGSDRIYIGAPPFMHRAKRKGANDAPLTITMRDPMDVYINADYDEV